MENKGNKNSKKVEETTTTANSIDKLAATAKTINSEVTETVQLIANDIITAGKEVTEVATKNVKEAVKSMNMTKSADKIKNTAKKVNTEVKDAAKEIVKDVKANTETVKTIANKTAKEVSEKVHVAENVSKIKETAKKVNSQIVETATVLMEDVKTNSKKMQANANKMAIEAIENVNITERVATIKKVAKTANEFTLETAEKLVDGAITNGEKWQNVANKAVKSGLKLAERQQDIVFTTLETVKGQLINSATRLKNMFNN
jgi:hypothetical protein